MSPRTPTLPPTEPTKWRKLLAVAHPDRNGDYELFIWAVNVRKKVCDGKAPADLKPPSEPESRRSPPPKAEPDCIPFDTACDFDGLTANVAIVAKDLPEPYAAVLKLLIVCEKAHLGPLSEQQERGASYKQLAAIAHTVGLTKEGRVQWYRIAEPIPLSRRHAGRILSKLKGAS